MTQDIDPIADVFNSNEPIAEEWPEPQEINPELYPVQAFDAEKLLPSILREWVMDTANRMSCAPDFPAAAVIVELGSVIGAGCGIKPKKYDDWIVAPNLWGMVVSPPSSKKSPAISKAFKPLDRLIAKARERNKEQNLSFERAKLISDVKKEALNKELKDQAKNEIKRLLENNDEQK